MEKVSDEFSAIVVEVRDTLQGIEAVLHELYANEFLDTEMRKQLEAAEQVYDRIADDIPRAEVVLLDKWNQIEHGVDRNSVRTIWNDRYKFPNSEPPLAAPIPAICGTHPRVPEYRGPRGDRGLSWALWLVQVCEQDPATRIEPKRPAKQRLGAVA